MTTIFAQYRVEQRVSPTSSANI